MNDMDRDIMQEMLASGTISQEDFDAHFDGTAVGAIVELSPEEEIVVEEGIAEQEQREQIYAEQDSSVHVADETPPPVAPVKTPKTPKLPKPPKTPKAPRDPAQPRKARINSGGTLGAYIASLIGDKIAFTDDTEADVKSTVDGLAKKIQEKAVNLFENAHNKKALSVYTRAGLTMLKTNGNLNNAGLVNELNVVGFEGKVYTIGTARSQAQQVVSLFRTVQMTNADGSANPKSKLLERVSA